MNFSPRQMIKFLRILIQDDIQGEKLKNMFNRVWPVFNGVHGKYAGLCNPTPPCQLEIWTFSYRRSRRHTEKYKWNINLDFKLFCQFYSKGTTGALLMIISYQMPILIGDTRTAFTQSEDTNPIPTDKTKRAVPGNKCRTNSRYWVL